MNLILNLRLSLRCRAERVALFEIEVRHGQQAEEDQRIYDVQHAEVAGIPRPKWAMLADTSVIANPEYANSFTLNGTADITRARTPRIFAIVSSTLK